MSPTFVLLLLGLASATTDGPKTEASRDLGYEPYDSPGHPDRWQLSSFSDCSGLVKPLLTGLLIGALLKLPLLLGKLLLLKATAPLAVLAALLPLTLFGLYRSSQQQTEQGGPANPGSRLLSDVCLHAAACGLGTVSPKTAVSSATWMLKVLERSLENEPGGEEGVPGYTEAYLTGASSKSCSAYACPYL